MFLCLVYLSIFVVLETWSTRVDTRFLADRERFSFSRLLPLPLDKPVDLIEDGHVSRFFVLLSGWSAPETWGDWTDGPKADMVVKLPDAIPSPYLKLSAQISIPPSGQQSIKLDAGAIRLGYWRLSSPSAIMCVPLPEQSGMIRISFVIGSPQRLASGRDPRELGLSLQKVEVVSGRKGCGPSAVFSSD